MNYATPVGFLGNAWQQNAFKRLESMSPEEARRIAINKGKAEKLQKALLTALADPNIASEDKLTLLDNAITQIVVPRYSDIESFETAEDAVVITLHAKEPDGSKRSITLGVSGKNDDGTPHADVLVKGLRHAKSGTHEDIPQVRQIKNPHRRDPSTIVTI